MANGKYSRIDGKKSLNFRSTTSLVAFVAFCLIAVWMLMSSAVPTRNQSLSIEEHLADRSSKQYEERFSELTETVTREGDNGSDSQNETNSEGTRKVQHDESEEKEVVLEEVSKEKVESESEKSDEENQLDTSVKEISDEKVETEEEPKTEKENDSDTKLNNQEASAGDELSNSETETTEKSSTNTSENEVPSQTDEEKVENNQDNNSEESDARNNSESDKEAQKSSISKTQSEYTWKLCNVTAGPDYIPCLDNLRTIRKLPSTMHYEHRERHCPEEASTCLVPLPEGYRRPIKWPMSREKIWYHNVPHTKLAVVKGHQNWVKVSGEYLTFPGGGTQFKNGALHYTDFIRKSLPDIAWGKRSRVILDVGCGVASFIVVFNECTKIETGDISSERHYAFGCELHHLPCSLPICQS